MHTNCIKWLVCSHSINLYREVGVHVHMCISHEGLSDVVMIIHRTSV